MEELGQAMMSIKYLEMRLDFIVYTKGLADEEYQRRAWINNESRPYLGTFSDAVSYYFDVMDLDDEPEKWIGVTLYNQAEADATRAVADALLLVFDEKGTKWSGEEYLTAKDWPHVVAMAKILLRVMDETEKGIGAT